MSLKAYRLTFDQMWQCVDLHRCYKETEWTVRLELLPETEIKIVQPNISHDIDDVIFIYSVE